jgi:hypothetical protein
MNKPWSSIKSKLSDKQRADIEVVAQAEVAKQVSILEDGYYIVEDKYKLRTIVQVCSHLENRWIGSGNYSSDMSIADGLKNFKFLGKIDLDALEVVKKEA